MTDGNSVILEVDTPSISNRVLMRVRLLGATVS